MPGFAILVGLLQTSMTSMCILLDKMYELNAMMQH